MAQLDQLQLDLKLLLEANGVKDAGRVCQKLYEHGVTTLTEFAELSVATLKEWVITEYSVCTTARRHAQALLVDNSHDLSAIRQQLLVRARMFVL